jgi:hypothetical protein
VILKRIGVEAFANGDSTGVAKVPFLRGAERRGREMRASLDVSGAEYMWHDSILIYIVK